MQRVNKYGLFPAARTIKSVVEKIEYAEQHDMAIMQDREELGSVIYHFIDKLNPSTILEIGSKHGGWLFVMKERYCPRLLISVDKHDGVRKELFNESLRCVLGDSTATPTIEAVHDILKREAISKIDLLHIDGYHTYEFALADWNNYSPLVKDGGIILFHDIMDPGPRKAFEEVRYKHLSSEIVSARTDGRHCLNGLGIGVIWKGCGTDRSLYYAN